MEVVSCRAQQTQKEIKEIQFILAPNIFIYMTFQYTQFFYGIHHFHFKRTADRITVDD